MQANRMKIKKQKKIKPSMIFSIGEPKEGDLCTLFYKRYRTLQLYNQLRNIFLIHIPNEGFGGKKIKVKSKKTGKMIEVDLYRRKLLSMGMFAGAADYLVCIKGGGCAFIEFKRNGKLKQSDHQIEFEQIVNALGIKYYLVWDVDTAMAILDRLNHSSSSLNLQ